MKTVKVKTSELEGAALDWAVALALGWKMRRVPRDIDGNHGGEVLAPPDLSKDFQYPPRGEVAPWYFVRSWSSNWSQCGPLIDEYRVSIVYHGAPDKTPLATIEAIHPHFESGSTVEIAVCRAIVASVNGEYVEIPEELSK